MKRIVFVSATVVIACVAVALVWLNFGRAEGPDQFGLSNPASTISNSASTIANSPSDIVDESETDQPSLDGEWVIADGSEAGYRVVEDLKGVTDFEAVGRTSQVAGSATIESTMITAATIEIDVASIQSDSADRDGHFREEKVMNAAEFPTATFALTEPADFSRIPSAGQPVTTTITGDLTLKDTTQQVALDVETQIVDSSIETVGSVKISFADYGITNPSNALVSVRDEGKIEFKLLFIRR